MKTFSSEDMNEFREFVRSDYFVNNTKVQKLFELLSKFHPEYSNRSLNEEWLYSKINPGLSFKKETIRKIFHGLSSAIESFLAQRNFESKPFEFYDNLFDSYSKMGLQKLGSRCIEKCDEVMGNLNSVNADFFLYGFKNSNNKANLLITTQPHSSAPAIDNIVDAISQRSYYITGFFIKEMVRCLDNILTIDKNFSINKDKYFVWNMFKSIDLPAMIECAKQYSRSEMESAVFDVYGAMYSAFSDFGNDNLYRKYRSLVYASSKYFSHDETRFHILRLMRYCLMRIAEGKASSKYENELFSIYNEFLEKKYYKSSLSPYLSVEAFRPILNLGLKLKKYKWTYEFINKYKSKLPPKRRANMFHYANALYLFHTGKHAESMKHSQKVEFDHFLFKLDLRDLMLMTLFELNATVNAFSHIDSYKHFLSKDNTISESEKKRHNVFVDIVKKIIEYSDRPDDAKLMKLERLLSLEHSNKEWVSEKVETIIGQKKKTG